MCIRDRYNTVGCADPCLVQVSEYAYHKDSVYRSEWSNANCRLYRDDGLAFKSECIHCDGTKLRLSDSDLGMQDQYSSTRFYRWGHSAYSLLFIFPTRVTLNTITLHYYSDSVRGLPRLKFYVVPDDFDIWDALTTSYRFVEVTAVPPGGEPAGRRNVSISVNFNTKKVLMHKLRSDFQLAVSEVEFFKCNCKPTW